MVLDEGTLLFLIIVSTFNVAKASFWVIILDLWFKIISINKIYLLIFQISIFLLFEIYMCIFLGLEQNWFDPQILFFLFFPFLFYYVFCLFFYCADSMILLVLFSHSGSNQYQLFLLTFFLCAWKSFDPLGSFFTKKHHPK